MATVGKLEKITLDRDMPHSEVAGTYSVIETEDGRRFLQIDTYGSNSRQILGKKSQSIRFSPDAIAQLRHILDNEI